MSVVIAGNDSTGADLASGSEGVDCGAASTTGFSRGVVAGEESALEEVAAEGSTGG